MKRILNKLERDEKGQALLIVLILLVIGGLIIGPLLGFMSTGLIVGQAYEWRMDELYAADSGVEDALWQIITKAAGLPQAGDDPPTWGYSIDAVNGKEFVDDPIIITYIDERTYKITSTATSTDTGSSTTIESYINILDFTFFAENAITSPSKADLKKNNIVNGFIQTPDPPDPAPSGDWTWDSDPIVGWPDETAVIQALRNFYRSQIPSSAPHYYTDTTITLNNTTIDSLYVDGNLELSGSGTGIGNLNGTIYVTGGLSFANKNTLLNFNNNTIYVEGQGYPPEGPPWSIYTPPGKISTTGPGCLISEQGINFQPKADSTGFIFVMSIRGMIWFKPGGDFIGSLAGNTNVDMQPLCILTNPGPPPDLNYPGGLTANNVIGRIRTWEISLQ